MEICLFSCTPVQKLSYFQNLSHDTSINKLVNKELESKIRKSDILSIAITSISPEANTIFNASVGGSSGGSGISSLGYILDNEGNIDIIKLGKIHVEGLTLREVKMQLEKMLLPYLKEPLVIVKFVNQKVTIIGDVGHTQVIPISQEKISLLDAIALSGDILPSGKKDNVLIIRETDSARIFKRIDLKNSSLFTSPYFYLKPDDIVYIEPKTVKKALSPEVIQLISIGLSTISLIIVIIKGFK